jgi:Domain of unknown function (DUF4399)
VKTPAAWLLSLAFTLSVGGAAAHGQDKKVGGPTPAPAGAAVYFIDLKDGATVGTTTTIHFGLRGMGVAPAGSEKADSGHHHLLIDVELPPLDRPIPNDFNHLHFGAGQTEADVKLAPGMHTLQLLLGDKNHVPHSRPVMSERVRVTVTDASQASTAAADGVTRGRHPAPAGAKVYFENLSNGAIVSRTLTVRFGLRNMGVAPAGMEKPNTGHHHLLIDAPLPPLNQRIPNDFNHLHFGAGQTEAKITLPVGHHTLQLLLGDDKHIPHDPPVFSERISVVVTSNGRTAHPQADVHPHREHCCTPAAEGAVAAH